MSKDFRINGFFPSTELCELLYKGSLKMNLTERLQFLVFHLWLRARKFTTLKSQYLKGTKENLASVLASFFASVAKQKQIQKGGVCENINCTYQGRFTPLLSHALIDRLGLNSAKTATYKALLLLHYELVCFLRKGSWESKTIKVFAEDEKIHISYFQPFPPPPKFPFKL